VEKQIAVRRGVTHEEFVRRFNQLRELGIYAFHVYEIADNIYATLPEIDSDVKGNT